MDGDTTDLRSLVEGSDIDSGIKGGAELIGFVEAVIAESNTDAASEVIGRARQAVVDALGHEAAVDAGAVIANFQRMVRIADSTGIPLDEPVVMMTQNIRDKLGLNEYHAAPNTPKLNPVKALVGRALGPFAPRLLRQLARNRSGSSESSGS